MPYWHDAIIPDLLAGRTVLVVAHGNSLRALVKHLDGISDEEISGLDIPTGIPLAYELDDGVPARRRGWQVPRPASGRGGRGRGGAQPGPVRAADIGAARVVGCRRQNHWHRRHDVCLPRYEHYGKRLGWARPLWPAEQRRIR